MNILITGTAGFIGFHVADYYIRQGATVYGMDSINEYYDIELKYARLAQHGIDKQNVSDNTPIQSSKYPNYTFVRLDLVDNENLTTFFRSHTVDVVCHLAAQAGVRYSIKNPNAYIQNNLVGFANLIEVSKNHHAKHFVYASSSSVYGLNQKMPYHESQNTSHPVSLYAATKKSNELMAHSYSHLFKLPTTGLRFFTVYGPWGRPDMAPFLFTKAIFENQPIHVYNNGEMYRDFTYVDDVVAGIAKVVTKPCHENQHWNRNNPDPSTSTAPFCIYNIGNNSTVKLLDFIGELEKATQKVVQKKFMPFQPGDVLQNFADISKLKDEFDYKPSTPISAGVKKFVNWYREFYKI